MKLVTRQAALRQAKQRYFTGQACVNGHTAERYVSSKGCVECNALRNTSEAFKNYRRTIKVEVFDAYGGAVCRCCGETEFEFLTIDHINNDGAAHRRSIAAEANNGRGSKTKYRAPSGFAVYFWLKKHKFPTGFQILCMNCNFAKGKLGYCPHQNATTH